MLLLAIKNKSSIHNAATKEIMIVITVLIFLFFMIPLLCLRINIFYQLILFVIALAFPLVLSLSGYRFFQGLLGTGFHLLALRQILHVKGEHQESDQYYCVDQIPLCF